jgi:predicted ATP-binding protein involved in virulence
MRIDHLQLENFKGFEAREFSFHPQFNLVVGENGSGKTSLVEALAIAAGSWFLGIRGYDSGHIRTEDVLLKPQLHGDKFSWEQQFPCMIRASGEVLGHRLKWDRALNSASGRTTYVHAGAIKALAGATDAQVRKGAEVLLPLVSYYGTGRLWNEPRARAQIKSEESFTNKHELSRFAGYRNSIDPRLATEDFVRFIARESWISFQRGGGRSPVFEAVLQAILRCVEGAESIDFDANLGEVVVTIAGRGAQPFNNLSDGQRTILAMVADLAQKAATLNPHLGAKVLEETPGIVLIDELDLHLHPKWQRHIVEDLRTTFPSLQFVCTSHSPFLIQSLRSGAELLVLDGQAPAELGNRRRIPMGSFPAAKFSPETPRRKLAVRSL